jgi:hypothetical protein
VLAALSGPAAADCRSDEVTRVIPLPVWATSPNEGTTWGGMPVLVHMCPDDHRTLWVLAPSVTWNSIIHFTATGRFYAYPARDTAFSLLAGASTRINYRIIGTWQHLPGAAYEWTDEALLRIDRDAFARFFGLGYDSMESDQSTYTAVRTELSDRRGLNLTEHVNAGVYVGFQHEGVDAEGVKGLPLAPLVFPTVPGMHGTSAVFSEGIDLRYDDRDGGDYAVSGMRVDAGIAVVAGLANSPTFLRGGFEGRWLVPELDWLSGAARVAYSGITSRDAPFYLQPTLGGSFLLRGFTEGRFYATQAWTAEFEQRVRALRIHMFGVTSDFRLDPFVAVGQVFDHAHDIVADPKFSVGVGLRAFVQPNLVGRVDLAEGGEGLKIYVEIGYPY